MPLITVVLGLFFFFFPVVPEFGHFIGPVINKAAFDKIKGYIDWARADPDSEIIAGGTCECLFITIAILFYWEEYD